MEVNFLGGLTVESHRKVEPPLPKTASSLHTLRPPGVIKRLLFKTDQGAGNLAECGLRKMRRVGT